MSQYILHTPPYLYNHNNHDTSQWILYAPPCLYNHNNNDMSQYILCTPPCLYNHNNNDTSQWILYAPPCLYNDNHDMSQWILHTPPFYIIRIRIIIDKDKDGIKLYFTLVFKTINIGFKLSVTNGNNSHKTIKHIK